MTPFPVPDSARIQLLGLKFQRDAAEAALKEAEAALTNYLAGICAIAGVDGSYAYASGLITPQQAPTPIRPVHDEPEAPGA